MMFQNNSLNCLNLGINIPFLILFQLKSLYSHCFKAFHDIENKKMNLSQHVERIWTKNVKIKSVELNKCTKIGNIPSSLEKSHKSMNGILWFKAIPISSSLTWKSLAINGVVLSIKTMFWEFLGRFSPMILNFPPLKSIPILV